jgi:hypothetical protein
MFFNQNIADVGSGGQDQGYDVDARRAEAPARRVTRPAPAGVGPFFRREWWVVMGPVVRRALYISAPTAITTTPSTSLCPPGANNRSSCITSNTCLLMILPENWRDVQNVDHVLGKYIISDRRMTEEEWARERATIIDEKAVAQFDPKPHKLPPPKKS